MNKIQYKKHFIYKSLAPEYLIFLFILSSGYCYSQYWSLGINAGQGKSNFFYNKLVLFEDFENTERYNLKINIEYTPVYSNMAIQSGFAYELKGDKNFDLEYLTLPLYFKYKRGKRFFINILFGMYYSKIIENPDKEKFKDFDFGCSFGGGLGFKLYKNIDFITYYINSIGLSSIYDKPKIIYGEQFIDETKNHCFSFNAGFIYNFLNN